MAQIVTITNPLTGQPAQVDQLDHTAQEIDDAIARALPGGNIDTILSLKAPLASPAFTGTPTINGVAVATVQTISSSSSGVNPNLLDNWYFANPVNQRGQTVYESSASKSVYTVDRVKWWGQYADGLPLTVTSDGLVAKSGQTSKYQNIDTYIPAKGLAGRKIKFSVLYKSTGNFYIGIDGLGTSYEGKASSNWNLYETILTVPAEWSNDTLRLFVGLNENDMTFTLNAWKLELGDQQTLAHKDENDNWVLNEIPDYGEQLARCQRYFQTFATESLRPTNALDFRPVMQATPALSTITVDGKTLYTASADL